MKLLLAWLVGVPATVAYMISWRMNADLGYCTVTRSTCSRPFLTNGILSPSRQVAPSHAQATAATSATGTIQSFSNH